MRILLLSDRIPPENRGGAGEVLWRLAVSLHQNGHDVHVISATDKAYFEEVREGIQTYHVQVSYPERFRAWYSLYNPQVNGRLKNLYQKIQPDVINAHNIHQEQEGSAKNHDFECFCSQFPCSRTHFLIGAYQV